MRSVKRKIQKQFQQSGTILKRKLWGLDGRKRGPICPKSLQQRKGEYPMRNKIKYAKLNVMNEFNTAIFIAIAYTFKSDEVFHVLCIPYEDVLVLL